MPDVDDGDELGLWSVVAIGVGGMVGGGIFAVLGLSVDLTRGGAPVAFLIGGAVAALTASSYGRLAARFPDRGGTTTYLNKAFGGGVLSGGLNVLLWLSYVVMLSLYATAFSSYLLTLLPGDPGRWTDHLVVSGVIVAITALNAASAASVGRVEEVIVGVKIAILVVFVVAGLTVVEVHRVAPAAWASPVRIVGGGMLIFLAYEGFELMANSAEEVADPGRTIPRALAIAVAGVTALYVLVAIVTVGVLSLPEIRAAEDFALAEAARPRLGQAGFTVIAVAAVLSTASAINATLYGATRLTFSVARSGELPAPFARRLWGGLEEGLLITSLLTLVVANGLDLSRISTLGSAGFLVIFAMVNVAQARLGGPGRSRWLASAAAVACAAALAALLAQSGADDPVATSLVGVLIGGAFAAEAGYRRATHRSIRLDATAPEGRDGSS